jgi:hypothetical protein
MSDPEYYETKLSEESREHRDHLETKLANQYAELKSLNGLAQLRLKENINRMEQTLAWQGANPKKIPFDELKEHIHSSGVDPIERKYVQRIKNRTTAMRAFCVSCMGDDVYAVKDCPSVTCPIHPFRMGGDPFRGYELPKLELEEDENDEELVGDFEDEDDADN